MKKTKKALASLTIAGMLATMVPFNAFASVPDMGTRLAGITAYDTAQKQPNKLSLLTAQFSLQA